MLLEESRLFLETYARLHDAPATCTALINGVLPQRSRETRATIVNALRMRLVRWNPPVWVLDDLVEFAQQADADALRAALMLHTARQERLLYDFVQQVIFPRWSAGWQQVVRSDVQGFLDTALEEHPEINRWSTSTREKIAGNVLTVLRDGGLLKGQAHKHIVPLLVPGEVVRHLEKLLQAEGVPSGQLAQHLDWRLWLWNPAQTQRALQESLEQEQYR